MLLFCNFWAHSEYSARTCTLLKILLQLLRDTYNKLGKLGLPPFSLSVQKWILASTWSFGFSKDVPDPCMYTYYLQFLLKTISPRSVIFYFFFVPFFQCKHNNLRPFPGCLYRLMWKMMSHDIWKPLLIVMIKSCRY